MTMPTTDFRIDRAARLVLDAGGQGHTAAALRATCTALATQIAALPPQQPIARAILVAARAERVALLAALDGGPA